MANQSLLPPNQSPLERLLGETLVNATELPSANLIRSLYDAKTCPADLLSYLAQAVAVDQWDHRWPEQQKRDVIKHALEIHRLKGTPLALLKALEGRGISATLREWWQQQDPQWYLPPSDSEPGTVVVQVLLNDNYGFDQTNAGAMNQALSHAKRHSIKIAHELGLKWDESIAMAMAASPAIETSDRNATIAPPNPQPGLGSMTVAGGYTSMVMADFEFGATNE